MGSAGQDAYACQWRIHTRPHIVCTCTKHTQPSSSQCTRVHMNTKHVCIASAQSISSGTEDCLRTSLHALDWLIHALVGAGDDGVLRYGQAGTPVIGTAAGISPPNTLSLQAYSPFCVSLHLWRTVKVALYTSQSAHTIWAIVPSFPCNNHAQTASHRVSCTCVLLSDTPLDRLLVTGNH